MAIEVSAAGITSVRLLIRDYYLETLNKVFTIGPAVADADLEAALTNFENLNNAGAVKASKSTNTAISGMSASASGNAESRVSVYAVLTFEQTSPYNPAVTLTKQFTIPAPLATLIDSSDPTHSSLIAPNTGAGAGTPAKRLGDLVAFLEDALALFIEANAEIVVGGWTYSPTKSKIITAPRVFDGGAYG